MRTTVDLPDDLHRLARELAHQRGTTLSSVVVDLLRRSLKPDPPEAGHGAQGLPTVSVGRVVTAEDVRQLEDS